MVFCSYTQGILFLLSSFTCLNLSVAALKKKFDLHYSAFSFYSCYGWKGVVCLLTGEEWEGVNIYTSDSSYGTAWGIAPVNQSTWVLMLQSSGGLRALGPIVLLAHCMSLGTTLSVSFTIFQLVKLGIIAYKPLTKSKPNNCEALWAPQIAGVRNKGLYFSFAW